MYTQTFEDACSTSLVYLVSVRGYSRPCHTVGISTVFKSSNTPRQPLVQLKNRVPPEKNGTVFKILSKHCNHMYIGRFLYTEENDGT